MPDNSNFDIKKVIEQGTKRVTLNDLAQRGFDNVKVLDEEAVHQMILQAIDRSVNMQTAEQRQNLAVQSRKELDRLMKEHKEMRGRSQLLEADKNELVEQVEALANELRLKEDMEEETLHKKLQEGLSSLQGQVDLLRKQAQTAAAEANTANQDASAARAEASRLQDDKARLKREVDEMKTRAEDARQTREAAVAQARQLQEEAARATNDRDRVEREAEADLARMDVLEKELNDERSKGRGAEKARTDLVQQVLGLQSKSDGQERELKSLRPELVRQRSELARLGQDLEQAQKEAESIRVELEKEREGGRRAEELDRALQSVRAEAQQLRDERGRLEQSHASLSGDVESRRSELARLQQEETKLRADLDRERETARLAQQSGVESSRRLQQLQDEVERLSSESERLRADRAELAEARTELETLRPRLEKAERDARAAQAEAERLHVERAALSHDADSWKVELVRRDEELGKASGTAEALRSRIQELEIGRTSLSEARAELETLRPRLEKAEREAHEAKSQVEKLRSERQSLIQDADTRKIDLDRRNVEVNEFSRTLQALRITETSLRTRVTELERVQTALSEAAAERDMAHEQLEQARQETAFLKGQLAQQQADHESERGKTVVIAAELQEIEDLQKAEKKEAERLRTDQERLGRDLESSREEIKALQELLGREQEAARVAQNDSAELQEQIAEAQARAATVEKEVETLRIDNARLTERVANAKLQQRLEGLEGLILAAKANSETAKDSADKSRAVTVQLERTLARQLQPKTKPKTQGSIRGGAAFDGMAVLENFLRKIRLREHFQKYVPVTEKPGRPHPSEMMVEVLKAIVAGQGKGPEGRSMVPLEIVGGTNAPDQEGLRQFLGGLSSQAVRALANVHHALKLHLTPLPKKPHALTLDVTTLELGKGNRRYRPIVAYDPETREFWNGQLRGNQDLTKDGMRDYLASLIGRIPKPFARNRIRLRMDESFFNEGVVRLLESKKVSYVIAAPDSPAIRKEARARAYHKLSNGWEVAEFTQRLHPIRRTQARYVVLRRRRSQEADKAGRGTFRDDRHVFHVFAVDRAATPWRSFEVYQARPASVADSRARLAEFETSSLLGRTRRSVTALFQAHLLASDLIQWFRRGCLPEEDRSRELPELRSEFLWTPSKTGVRSLLVLPRKDRRRKLFSRVTGLTRRVRPARPFKFRS